LFYNSVLQIRGVFEYFTPLILAKKSLKKPKGKSESVNRRTDNTMAKRKSTKGQTTIHKTYTES
jgi:hypothetical protein